MDANTMVELTDDDEQVLDVMAREGRANPYLIRQRTGLGKGDVNTSLNRLARDGQVRQIVRGLYEYAGGTPLELSPATGSIVLGPGDPHWTLQFVDEALGRDVVIALPGPQLQEMDAEFTGAVGDEQ